MRAMMVTVVGAGYVGLSSALALAAAGHRVRVFDRRDELVALLRRGIDPLGEPYVTELLAALPVEFTTDPGAAYEGAAFIVIAVGTPTTDAGHADLEQLDDACRTIARVAPRCDVLIRSTVPVGTCDRLQGEVLKGFRVISNPEFLREGYAAIDSFHPNRIVAGGASGEEAAFRELYGPILEQTYPAVAGLAPRSQRPKLFWMSRRSAELTKYAANGLLAAKLSFVNEIANVAATVRADMRDVAHALEADTRIGEGFLHPGLGWGGSCLPKDTRALAAMASEHGYDFALLHAVIRQNDAQLARFHTMIEREFVGRSDVRIGLLGLAFKSGTSDCRQSPAATLAELFIARGWSVSAYDPAVKASPFLPRGIAIAGSTRDAAAGADALVVATEWPEFATMDLPGLRRIMRGGLIFDGRCIVGPREAAKAGFRYHGVCPSGED